VASRFDKDLVRQVGLAAAFLALLALSGARLATYTSQLPRVAAAPAGPVGVPLFEDVVGGEMARAAAGSPFFAPAPPQPLVQALLTDITGTITPGGPPVQVDITEVDQNAYFTFDGIVGHSVSVQM